MAATSTSLIEMEAEEDSECHPHPFPPACAHVLRVAYVFFFVCVGACLHIFFFFVCSPVGFAQADPTMVALMNEFASNALVATYSSRDECKLLKQKYKEYDGDHEVQIAIARVVEHTPVFRPLIQQSQATVESIKEHPAIQVDSGVQGVVRSAFYGIMIGKIGDNFDSVSSVAKALATFFEEYTDRTPRATAKDAGRRVKDMVKFATYCECQHTFVFSPARAEASVPTNTRPPLHDDARLVAAIKMVALYDQPKHPRSKSSVFDAMLCIHSHAIRDALRSAIDSANKQQKKPSFARGDHSAVTASAEALAQGSIDAVLALFHHLLAAAVVTCRPYDACRVALEVANIALRCVYDTFSSYKELPTAVASGVAKLLADSTASIPYADVSACIEAIVAATPDAAVMSLKPWYKTVKESSAGRCELSLSIRVQLGMGKSEADVAAGMVSTRAHKLADEFATAITDCFSADADNEARSSLEYNTTPTSAKIVESFLTGQRLSTPKKPTYIRMIKQCTGASPLDVLTLLRIGSKQDLSKLGDDKSSTFLSHYLSLIETQAVIDASYKHLHRKPQANHVFRAGALQFNQPGDSEAVWKFPFGLSTTSPGDHASGPELPTAALLAQDKAMRQWCSPQVKTPFSKLLANTPQTNTEASDVYHSAACQCPECNPATKRATRPNKRHKAESRPIIFRLPESSTFMAKTMRFTAVPVDVYSNTGALIFIIVASIVQHDPPKKKKGFMPCVVHFAFFDKGCGFHFVQKDMVPDFVEHVDGLYTELSDSSKNPHFMFELMLMNGASDTEHSFAPFALAAEDPDTMIKQLNNSVGYTFPDRSVSTEFHPIGAHDISDTFNGPHQDVMNKPLTLINMQAALLVAAVCCHYDYTDTPYYATLSYTIAKSPSACKAVAEIIKASLGTLSSEYTEYMNTLESTAATTLYIKHV